ncbi:MAG: zinc ribbon domain-containing protein [Chloroflexota bacterium]
MPTYEYECPSCSSRFEQKRSFTDESKVKCPKCQRQARRIFSPVPIIFKGSGFYVTDHKGDHGHSAPSSSDKPATGEAGKATAESGDMTKVKAGGTEAKAKDSK